MIYELWNFLEDEKYWKLTFQADGATKFSSLTSINSTESIQEVVEEYFQNDILGDYVVCPDSNFKCKSGKSYLIKYLI